MEEVSNFCPAIAVPTTVKIPEPITAPMPSAVRETGPRVFFSRRSGSSASAISLSMDLQHSSWLPVLSGSEDFEVTGGCAKGFCFPCAVGGRVLCPPFPVLHTAMVLPLRLAAHQLLDFALRGATGDCAFLQRLFRLAFLARGGLCFLAIFFTQTFGIGHEC